MIDVLLLAPTSRRQIREACERAARHYRTWLAQLNVADHSITLPLCFRNVALYSLQAGVSRLTRALDALIIRGTEIPQANEVLLAHPVNVFGTQCVTLEQCYQAADAVGVICGLLRLDVRYTYINQYKLGTSLPNYKALSKKTRPELSVYSRTPYLVLPPVGNCFDNREINEFHFNKFVERIFEDMFRYIAVAQRDVGFADIGLPIWAYSGRAGDEIDRVYGAYQRSNPVVFYPRFSHYEIEKKVVVGSTHKDMSTMTNYVGCNRQMLTYTLAAIGFDTLRVAEMEVLPVDEPINFCLGSNGNAYVEQCLVHDSWKQANYGLIPCGGYHTKCIPVKTTSLLDVDRRSYGTFISNAFARTRNDVCTTISDHNLIIYAAQTSPELPLLPTTFTYCFNPVREHSSDRTTVQAHVIQIFPDNTATGASTGIPGYGSRAGWNVQALAINTVALRWLASTGYIAVPRATNFTADGYDSIEEALQGADQERIVL